MKSPILFSSFFPSIQYFHILNKHATAYIDIHENYIKQTYRNRCELYSANGILLLTVPIVKKENPHLPIKEIKIAYNIPWQKTHNRAIKSAYNSSPYFLYYIDAIYPFFEKHFTFLVDLNEAILNVLIKQTSIATQIIYTESYIENCSADADYRNIMNKKNQLINHCFIPYTQVFEKKNGFISNLSVLDLLFNVGPEFINYL